MLVALTFAATAGASAAAAKAPEIGLIGNDQVLWVHQQRVAPDGKPLLRFVHRRVTGELEGMFMPQIPVPIAGTM